MRRNRTSKLWHTFSKVNKGGIMNKVETAFWNLWGLCSSQRRKLVVSIMVPNITSYLPSIFKAEFMHQTHFTTEDIELCTCTFQERYSFSVNNTMFWRRATYYEGCIYHCVLFFFQNFQSQEKFVILKLTPLRYSCPRTQTFISFVYVMYS